MRRIATLVWAAAMLAVAACSSLALAGSPTHFVGAAKAQQLSPPRAWTTEAESLEATDEWLNGIIDPGGVPTAYHFQLGATKSYGRIITGTRGTYERNQRYEVGAPAFNLRPRITYHYRIVATSGGGTTYGADKTFKTAYRARAPRSVIACFQEKDELVAAFAHPRRCDFRGYRGKKLVQVPVDGMRWGHWGFNPTRAAHGSDMRDGARVRIIAFRPVTCDEGRTWYSRIAYFNLASGDGFVLRLPTCEGTTDFG